MSSQVLALDNNEYVPQKLFAAGGESRSVKIPQTPSLHHERSPASSLVFTGDARGKFGQVYSSVVPKSALVLVSTLVHK
jgi:hypothetical protein